MNQNWIVCLGGSLSKTLIIKAIKNKGFNSIVIDRNPNCVCKKIADVFLNFDIGDDKSILKELKKYDKKNKIVLILSYTSNKYAQFCAQKLSNKLKTPFCSKNTLEIAWNKKQLKLHCSKNNINYPLTLNTNNPKKIKNFLIKHKKLIKKPISGVGSESISVLNKNNFNLKLNNQFQYEKFLGDKIFSVGGIIINNNVICSIILKKHIRKPTFTIDGYSSFKNPNEKKMLCSIIEKFLKSLKINNIFFGFDIIKFKDKFYVIDFGILLDSEVHKLLEFSGINIFEIFFDRLFYNKKSSFLEFNQKICMSFLYPKKTGIIKKSIIDKLLNDDLFLEINQNKITKIPSNPIVSDKLGHIITNNLSWRKTKKITAMIEDKIIK